MIQLSKRLKMVADLVSRGNTVSDVGCDHAYLSIYLIKHEISPYVIAMDINKGPLKIAEKNIIKHKVSEKVELRLSDGLDMLKPLEADTIILAGMGGDLMTSILMKGMECVRKAKELILQPQSEPHKVRRFLKESGYHIIYEDMCIDTGKYYTVVKACNTYKACNICKACNACIECNTYIACNTCIEGLAYENINEGMFYHTVDTYGKYLLENKNSILKDYLINELNINQKIQHELMYNLTSKANERLLELKESEERIQYALSYFT